MHKSLINGEEVGTNFDSAISIFDKYTGEELAQIPYINSVDMKNAISFARDAQIELAKLSAGARSEKLYTLAELLKRDSDKLSKLICSEAGKPINYAKAEIKRCITTVLLSAEEAKRMGGEVVPMDFSNGEGREAYTKRIPIGVIGAISPFNFPLNLALHKVAPALASGCSVILKPSPYTPLSAIHLGHLVLEAGFPKAALNIVICEVPVAEVMIKDSGINMISFTGSPQVGWHLKSLAKKKKVTLELGGNASVIVDKSSDIETAAKSVAMGAFLYSGQICISTQRIFVEDSIYDKFEKLLVDATKKLPIGDCRKEEIILGPLIDKVHFQRIESWVNEALDNGAKLLCGGEAFDKKKNLYKATLLTNVKEDQKVDCQEVFGPVACLYRFRSFDDAIAGVNNSSFGLQAGVFTNQLDHMKRSFNELKVGGVMINNVPGFRIDHMPYGGVKDSGLGREGVKYAIEDMTEPRLLVF